MRETIRYTTLWTLCLISCHPGLLVAFECDGIEPVPDSVLGLQLVSDRLQSPVDVQSAPGETGRLFVVEQRGLVRIIDLASDSLLPSPFLDIRTRIRCCGEMGLLGLAFHPDFAENGYFFVNSTRPTTNAAACRPCVGGCVADTVIARYRVSAEDPNRADPDSELEILRFGQPFENHNAGQLAFGPLDGYLYISTGDGGSGGDPCRSGQDPLSFLGKMLRIDVDASSAEAPYAIPADNPFAGQDGILAEIWALGLRNPWRFSFDPENGDLYIGDVGQNSWEEIDYQPGASAGGQNYEWRIREGDNGPSTGSFGPGTRVAPVLDYPHGAGFFVGCSVVGGVVYRGCRMSEIRGLYFLADYCNDWVGTFSVVDGRAVDLIDRTRELNAAIAPDRMGGISSFGVDGRGEIYICCLPDSLYRIVPDSATNHRPVARIEPDPILEERLYLVEGSATVTLDGDTSDDGDGGAQPLTYSWEVVRGPRDYTIADPAAAVTTITFTRHGEFTIRLTVSDGTLSDTDGLEITVYPEIIPPYFQRGDAAADGNVDITDGISILDFLFDSGAPFVCFDAADVDDSSAVLITDAVYLFNYLFLGGPDPAAPFVECGTDPTRDDPLTCGEHPPCAI